MSGKEGGGKRDGAGRGINPTARSGGSDSGNRRSEGRPCGGSGDWRGQGGASGGSGDWRGQGGATGGSGAWRGQGGGTGGSGDWKVQGGASGSSGRQGGGQHRGGNQYGGGDNQTSSSSSGHGYVDDFRNMNIESSRSQGSGGGGGRNQGSYGGRDGGNFGGGRGDNNRGGGRGGRGGARGVGTAYASNETPQCLQAPEPSPVLGPKWKLLPKEKEDIQLPARKDFAIEKMTFISLKANHYPTKIKFPAKIYHYDVEKILPIRESRPDSVPKAPQNGKSGGDPKAGNSSPDEPKYPRHIRILIHQKLVEVVEANYKAATKGQSIGVISDKSKTLYSTKQLETVISMQIKVVIQPDGPHGKTEQFTVTIKDTTENIDTRELQKLIYSLKGTTPPPELTNLERVYNTLLKNLKDATYTPIGRSALICFEKEGFRLGGGLVNFTGYDVTVGITGNWKPFLNIHYANCATILNKNIITVLADIFNLDENDCRTPHEWSPNDFQKAKSVLLTCKVQYHPYNGRPNILSGTITDVSPKSISENFFMLNEGPSAPRRVSVYDYYKNKYQRKDLNPDGLCLILNKKNQVPAEICEIKKGQSVNRKLDGNQTTNMLRIAKKDPIDLMPIIDKGIPQLKLKTDSNMREFGVSFEDKVSMISFDKTRVLAPPELCYEKMRVIPDNGLWDSWRLNAKFLQPRRITSWGILITCSGFRGKSLMGAVGNFKSLLTKKGVQAGLQFQNKEPVVEEMILRDNRESHMKNVNALTTVFTKIFKNCEIVLVVIPSKGCDLYTHVKQAAELKAGTLTQCVVSTNFDPQKPERTESIVGNILLKINSKLGGVNHVVDAPKDKALASAFTIFNEPVIILGADVTHPPPEFGKDESEQTSYAAVTCSINRTGMPFMMHVQAQSKAGKGAAEVVQNLDDIVLKCMAKFWEMTKMKPRKIIYYRDGVGEGQFPELLHKEMRQIRKACSEVGLDDNGEPYQPAITFITVQKRHKTRFFMSEIKDTRNQNPPPGTVVDTEIVHPRENDFFLLSHVGALGTSRPTRYHVLWDDSDFSSDRIQQLTYYLCYMYVRCNRSVSIPAPTYYAHWAAARAKVLAEGIEGNNAQKTRVLERHAAFQTKFPMHFV